MMDLTESHVLLLLLLNAGYAKQGLIECMMCKASGSEADANGISGLDSLLPTCCSTGGPPSAYLLVMRSL